MAHDVFISYSSKDKNIADAVCAVLEKHRIRCWIAPRDTPAGDFADAIIKAISAAKVMVVIFSAHANLSENVKSEVAHGVSKGLIIIPFRIQNVTPSGTLAFYLSTKHWLDAFTPPIEQHIEQLAGLVQRIFTGEQLPAGLRPAPPKRKWYPWILGCILLLLAIIVPLVLFLSKDRAPEDNQLPNSSVIINSLLDFTENDMQKTQIDFPQLEEIIALYEQSSRDSSDPLRQMRDSIMVGQLYEASTDYRKALNSFTRAYEAAPDMADPYYAIGGLYYELALVDLVKKKRFTLDSVKLTFTLEPDGDSKAIFLRVLEEYDLGDDYPTYDKINPSDNIMLTSPYIVAHRKREINNFLAGSPTITLHRVELLLIIGIVQGIFPQDEQLIAETVTLTGNLLKYIEEHPEEFPGLLLPSQGK